MPRDLPGARLGETYEQTSRRIAIDHARDCARTTERWNKALDHLRQARAAISTDEIDQATENMLSVATTLVECNRDRAERRSATAANCAEEWRGTNA